MERGGSHLENKAKALKRTLVLEADGIDTHEIAEKMIKGKKSPLREKVEKAMGECSLQIEDMMRKPEDISPKEMVSQMHLFHKTEAEFEILLKEFNAINPEELEISLDGVREESEGFIFRTL